MVLFFFRRMGSGDCCCGRSRDCCRPNCERYGPIKKTNPSKNFPSPSTIELGAKVIAAAGSADKIEIAKKYGGADYGINYSKPGWQKQVLDITKGHGVDVVYDPVGLVNGMRKN